MIRISVEAPNRTEARRTAQELAELATVLFNDRFGPGTVASVWEAPRAEEGRVSPRPARNLALGALAGALLGQLLLVGRRRRPRPVASAPPVPLQAREPEPEPETEQAPELELEPSPERAPEPEPEPEPVRTGPFVRPRLGEWKIADVELLLAQEGSRFPDRLDELSWYIGSFRDVAEEDGRLPGGVDIIVEEIFGDLIASAERVERADGESP